MNTSKSFLERLLLKLKTGSSRSIHLNALPGRFARLDLYDLINIDQSLHLKFIQQLLNKPKVKFSINIDFKEIQKKSEEEIKVAKKIVKTLNSLYYQQQDEFLEHGTKTFGFGYPLLIKRDPNQPDKVIKAPLLIWYLNIEKDLHQVNTWTLSRTEEHPIIFNELLRNHIETNEKIQIDDVLDLFDENMMDELKLLTITEQTLIKLGTKASENDNEIKVLPGSNKASIEKITQNDPWIRWSGIFGLYKTQKQSIIKDVESLIENYSYDSSEISDTENDYPTTENLTVVPLDPSQESILNAINHEEKIIIQGPPGTGKSQSLTGIISNAIYQEKTCLVVCEKKTAMDIIYKNLAEHNLDKLCIVIDDVNRDRKKVVDRVRQILEQRNETYDTFEHHKFEESLAELKESKTSLNDYYKLLNTKTFGDYNLINLIGYVQKLKSAQPYIDLREDLRSTHFEYDYEEYKKLLKIVETGLDKFGNLPHKSFALKQLFDEHFEGAKTEPILLFDDLKIMKESTDRILEILEDELQDSPQLFNSITPINNFKIGFGSLYSSKMKRIKASRALILSEWNILTEHFYERIYFHHVFPEIDEIKRFSEIQPSLKALKGKIDQILKDEKHYNEYYTWRKFIINQPENLRVLFLILSEKVNRKLWLNSFQVYYTSAFIDKFSKEFNLPKSIKLIVNRLNLSSKYMQATLPDKVKNLWDKKQQKVFYKRTISNLKALYNYRRNKTYGRINSLRKIIHKDFELFATAFPVVMVNPSVCSSIFPLKSDLFDLVLFDEASQLRIEDTYPSLLRGKHKIVSGDKHQMPPPNYFHTSVDLFPGTDVEEDEEISDDFLAASNSLLDFCMDADFYSTYLDFHYRSKYPDLIAFSNVAFYGSRLVPMPAIENKVPIKYIQTNGVYSKQRTNVIEATAVVSYVYESIKKINGNYPSIGIATFNINQRNLIWDLLIEASYSNEGNSLKLQRLIEAGLFVKNLENVQGDERDIILISTTFGVNKNGEFKQQFGPITQQKGYQLLNVIVTRAKHNLVLFTSIPETYSSSYNDEISAKGNSGKGILYAYLHYAKAISEQNEAKKANILEVLNRHCSEENYQHEFNRMPIFHQQIYSELVNQFGQEVIQHNYRFGGFILEFCVVVNNRPLLSISTDYMLTTNNSAYKMPVYKSDILKLYGINTYSISTLEWNNNWKQELQKLIEYIQKLF